MALATPTPQVGGAYTYQAPPPARTCGKPRSFFPAGWPRPLVSDWLPGRRGAWRGRGAALLAGSTHVRRRRRGSGRAGEHTSRT